MNKIISKISCLLAFVTVFTLSYSNAFAQKKSVKEVSTRDTSTPIYTSSSSPKVFATYTNETDGNYIYGALGLSNFADGTVTDRSTSAATLSGLLGLGADIEHIFTDNMGLGGLARYYTTDDDIKAGASSYKLKASLWVIGGFARFHIPHKSWDFSVAPGFGLGSLTQDSNGQTNSSGISFMPSFALTVMYAIDDKIAMGVENLRIFGLGTAVNGTLQDDFMFKMRLSL